MSQTSYKDNNKTPNSNEVVKNEIKTLQDIGDRMKKVEDTMPNITIRDHDALKEDETS